VTLYRVVQEALTNTVRHSGARRVDVRLRWLEAAVEVEVVDDGSGGLSPKEPPGSGLGLVGMRERVDVHDGVLEVGPRLDGGYRVRARFPLAALPSAVTPATAAAPAATGGAAAVVP
jgi:signal transduction histidine kinase